MDLAKNVNHDYKSLFDINSKFDIITMLELIEHLPLSETLKYFTKAYELLNTNRLLICSTPNIDHINQLWKQDIAHIHQYLAKDIYAILRMIGFKGKIDTYIIFLTTYKPSIKYLLKTKIKIYLTKILDIDYAHGIILFAKKNSE
jgi:DNA-directed RNA polymerase